MAISDDNNALNGIVGSDYGDDNIKTLEGLEPRPTLDRVKEAVFGVRMGNVFNSHYATSGWVYSSILEGYNHPDSNRYYQIGFIPMAGRSLMGSLSVKF